MSAVVESKTAVPKEILIKLQQLELVTLLSKMTVTNYTLTRTLVEDGLDKIKSLYDTILMDSVVDPRELVWRQDATTDEGPEGGVVSEAGVWNLLRNTHEGYYSRLGSWDLPSNPQKCTHWTLLDSSQPFQKVNGKTIGGYWTLRARDRTTDLLDCVLFSDVPAITIGAPIRIRRVL